MATTSVTSVDACGRLRDGYVFGMGCFWGAEEVMRAAASDADVCVGYCGGKATPDHKMVSRGKSGHVEAVRVILHSSSSACYEDLLTAFFNGHDAAAFKAKSQYHSTIFADEGTTEHAQAVAMLKQYPSARTVIRPSGPFYPAEERHQRYFTKGNNSVLRPKKVLRTASSIGGPGLSLESANAEPPNTCICASPVYDIKVTHVADAVTTSSLFPAIEYSSANANPLNIDGDSEATDVRAIAWGQGKQQVPSQSADGANLFFHPPPRKVATQAPGCWSLWVCCPWRAQMA
eukprot:TRINITY_DN71712_c0_g1_i1.p1 TRINITY_DN71712_c0_g1~~TRINITY_DN71712_c0_g1_i1.p1  ORF type:complete len:289 (+),score=31.93 TRINITY_DN71712_c0_g1_i1:55-921(+)